MIISHSDAAIRRSENQARLSRAKSQVPNPFEIIVILAVALIVLGPERLPEVMRAAGKIMRELRLASNTVLREMTEVLDDDASRKAPASAVTRSITEELPTAPTRAIGPAPAPENRAPEKP